ncbi:MAG: DUF2764 domain-containing protein [Deltaproteobacteria bacterium]|nr:DUF2764 domain-containing protein [Deltaproteobacteria bacterium]
MAENYYFLVAGLPEADFDAPRECPSFPDFAKLAKDHLLPSDVLLFQKIQLTIDIGNLAALMERGDHLFTEGGLYEKEALQEGLHDPHIFPPCMQQVIEAWQSDIPVFHNITWEDQLNWLFYEAMEAVESRFLRKWFAFDVTFNNLLAVMSCSEFNIPIERRVTERIENICTQAVITRNEAAEAIVNSSDPDFSLPPIFPLASRVLSLDRSDLENFEKSMDRIRWDWLTEAVVHNYFDIDFILAYGLKLKIMDRWKRLTPQAGKERFEGLLHSFESSCQGVSMEEVIP